MELRNVMNKICMLLCLILLCLVSSVSAYDTNMSPEIYRSYGRQQQKANSDSGFIQDSLQEMISEWYSRKIANETLRGCKENARTRDPESGYVYQNGGSAPFWLKPYKVLKGKDTQGTPFYRTYWAENTDIYSAKINGEVVSKTMWEWGKFIFLELRLRQAKSYKDIADFANAIKLPISRKSKLARKNTLSLQAKHEILYGTVIYNKHHYNNNYKKGSLKLQEEWVIVENGVPALMTKEEFDLLQDINNQKARKKDSTSSNSKNEKLLVDMPDKFYCASCGSKIISSGKHYVCSEYNSHGRQGCKAKSFYLPSDWLDDKVQKEIIKLYLNDDVIQTLYENYVLAKNKQKIELNNNKQEATILQKEIYLNSLENSLLTIDTKSRDRVNEIVAVLEYIIRNQNNN